MTRTSLTPYAASMRDVDPQNARRAAQQAYEQSGGAIVLINREWLPSWVDRKQLEILAEVAGVKSKGE